MDNGDPFSERIVDIYDNDAYVAPYNPHIHHNIVNDPCPFRSVKKIEVLLLPSTLLR